MSSFTHVEDQIRNLIRLATIQAVDIPNARIQVTFSGDTQYLDSMGDQPRR